MTADDNPPLPSPTSRRVLELLEHYTPEQLNGMKHLEDVDAKLDAEEWPEQEAEEDPWE